jgi:hypothetical protein
MDTSNLTHMLAHTLSISLSRSVYTIAQRDLVFRLKPSANALIGRGDSGGIMDMKVRPMFRACLCSNSRVSNPNAAEGLFKFEQLPDASPKLYEEFKVRPARAYERDPRICCIRRRRSAARRLYEQEFKGAN